MNNSSEDQIKAQLQQMDAYDFEELVGEVWRLEGYETIVHQGSGDRGIDVEATKQTPFEEKVLIQVKRYSGTNKVSSADIRKYATLYQQESDVDTVAIVTTGEFTSEAKELARDLNVKTVDGRDFTELVSSYLDSLDFEKKSVEESDTRQHSGDNSANTSDLNNKRRSFEKVILTTPWAIVRFVVFIFVFFLMLYFVFSLLGSIMFLEIHPSTIWSFILLIAILKIDEAIHNRKHS